MAVLWTEDFEDAGGATSQAGVTRSAPQHLNANGTFDGADAADFSFRSNQTEGATLTNPFTNLQGSYAWLAHDVDGIPGFAGSDTDVLNWTGIDITGETDLTFSGFFGAISQAGSGFNQWDDGDFISIEVQIDGGGYVEILRFEGTSGVGVGDLAVDTNGDGVGDGTVLTEALALFDGIAIAGTGSALDLRITFEADGGQEELAFDHFQISGGASGPINGTPGNDVLEGTAADDEINGLAGNDTLAGFEGIDTINGDAGNDRLFGGDDNDILNGGDNNDQLWGGEGADALDGGAGIDGAYYIDATSGVTLNTFAGGSAGDAAGDTYTNIERFFGSNFADNLTGAAGNDYLAGLGGNDIINGAGGNDILVGGLGVDTINGGADNDTILGSQGGDLLNGDAGDDIIRGGADNDMLNGGDDNDNLYAGTGNDTLSGDAGNDRLFGESGTNTLNGGAGNDLIFAGSGADAIDGGSDTDSVFYSATASSVTIFLNSNTGLGGANGDTYANVENIYGSQFNDLIIMDDNDNVVAGLDGNDILNARGGNDRLLGGDGDDQLEGGYGNDIYIGGAGSDTIYIDQVGDNGVDRILDWVDGEDVIRYESSQTGIDEFSDLTITQTGTATRIDSAAGTIYVINSTATDFTSADFEFTAPPPMGEPLDDGFIKSAPAIAESAFAAIESAQLPAAFADGDWPVFGEEWPIPEFDFYGDFFL